ncbi:hypothetical protein DV735_g5691, partial [Chaetothyriales sp. CBS 134920]
MSGAPATFWSAPVRYIRWAFYQKPAIAYAVAIGSIAPTIPFWVPPLRRAVGDNTVPHVPHSYPGAAYRTEETTGWV